MTHSIITATILLKSHHELGASALCPSWRIHLQQKRIQSAIARCFASFLHPRSQSSRLTDNALLQSRAVSTGRFNTGLEFPSGSFKAQRSGIRAETRSQARLLDFGVENAGLDGVGVFHLNKDAVAAGGGKAVGELDGGGEGLGGCDAHDHAGHSRTAHSRHGPGY
jgi:hypothetical protein